MVELINLKWVRGYLPFPSLFVIFAVILFIRAMLLSATSFLYVSAAKTGHAPRQGAKSSAQKNTPKQLHPSKESSRNERQVSEEDRIIQAAEKYHQQLSGKNTAPTAKKLVSKVSNSVKYQDSESKGNSSDRDQNVNIYTGNPGYYQSDGDTLNFWSFTPVPVDSLSLKVPVTLQPGKPYGFEGKPMKMVTQDWTFFLIIIGWMVFASLRFGFTKYMVQVFQSIFNYSISARLFREQGYSNNFGLFRLNLIFYLFVPFSIFLIARDNGVSMTGFGGMELYVIVLAVANGYFMLKILLYKILGSIFSKRETTGELVFNMMLYHNVLGLILLPIATIHSMVPALAPVSLFVVPGLIVLFYLMSVIRSIFFAFREGVSIFYLILYLCALEILPILLVAKLATNG